ncbi:DNA polymerase IV [Leptolyngbya sp. FACHB-711]|uniref:DNA polymerase IV n=1 Tax=Leptolyngbya sp. FACHB-711 TaxID=2692813 RepID=UPI0016854A02|nr:DNA polymerase IV [Leptolyngbya sp. FACHB-711]MBD2026327.1 DNA polymerase IV [Leptolyngbya sp. FACHB-711]
MTAVRKIIHVDMDAFYASVEQRDEPKYRGKPIVVGGSPNKRGAVAAASYEARRYGIHSAMPSRTAHQKCPHLIFVKPRFEVYRRISLQIRNIFYRYTDWVEPLALDEAYLDVTENKFDIPSATWIAQTIKQEIYEETGLTASAGVSINKFLAKVASGMDKPNGLFIIPPEDAAAFVEQLPIEQFYGVGQVTAAKMHKLGIQTGADLKQWSLSDLVRHFGKVGQYYYKIARAEDDRPLQPNRIRKSIGAENSYDPDLSNRSEIETALEEVAGTLLRRLDSQRAVGRTLTLKVKYADYQQVTRSRTLVTPIGNRPGTDACSPAGSLILDVAHELLETTDVEHKAVRLLGLTISNLAGEAQEHYIQLCLNV